MLSSHRTVLGILVLSRATPPSIIRHSGVVFEGEQGKKYAKAVGRIVDACKRGLDEVDGGEGVRIPNDSEKACFDACVLSFTSVHRMISSLCVYGLSDTKL
jgi:hypothetical protein